jgi:uncharacterized protein (UPF0335 family)
LLKKWPYFASYATIHHSYAAKHPSFVARSPARNHGKSASRPLGERPRRFIRHPISFSENIMSDAPVSDDQLRLFIERIERLEEEKKGISDDIRDVYLESKSQGYDPKIMRQIVRLRKLPPHDRKEMEAILDIYKNALGID